MRVHHIALKTADPVALAAWYGGVFGLPELSRSADGAGIRSVWLDLEGTILMIERADAPGAVSAALAGTDVPTGVGWHGVYFVAEAGARASWLARFAAVGVSPFHRTASTLYVRDPDGNVVGVSAYPAPL